MQIIIPGRLLQINRFLDKQRVGGEWAQAAPLYAKNIGLPGSASPIYYSPDTPAIPAGLVFRPAWPDSPSVSTRTERRYLKPQLHRRVK